MSQQSFWVSVTHVCRYREWKYGVQAEGWIFSFRSISTTDSLFYLSIDALCEKNYNDFFTIYKEKKRDKQRYVVSYSTLWYEGVKAIIRRSWNWPHEPATRGAN